MARGTKKVGIAGKFGPRYGVTIRKRIRDASRHRQSPQQCPECQHFSVKRESTGIWVCRHCNLKFAAAAYSTRTRSFKKDESVSISDRAYRADEDEIAAMKTSGTKLRPHIEKMRAALLAAANPIGARTDKRDSNWGYSWIPVLGPICGAAIASFAYRFLF